MVRATFSGFTTAYSALQANQKRLDLVGQNLSNMNTVGYTRQQLQASSLNFSNPISYYRNNPELTVGFGVRMDAITQIRDPYLDMQYRDQMTKSGYSESLQESLDQLSEIFDESHIKGIRKAFDDIKSTLTSVQDGVKVNDPIFQAELRTRMQTLTNLFNDGARQIEAAREAEFLRLDGVGSHEQGAVDQINDILQQIGSLNRKIKQNQILGQPSLELMDQRNVLVDELSSYLPIQVTYKKDAAHDGVDGSGSSTSKEALSETYHLDSSGNPIMKKEWPDDLWVSMEYMENGVRKEFDLIRGTEGSAEQNHAVLRLLKNDSATPAESKDPTNIQLNFYQAKENGTPDNLASPAVSFQKPATAKDSVAFQFTSGSVQASLDMLWKDGTDDLVNNVKGYDYYMGELDTLAFSFAKVMNTLNGLYETDKADHSLLTVKDSTKKTGAAETIGISTGWINGTVSLSVNGTNTTDTALNMLEAMQATYPYSNLKKPDPNDPTKKVPLFNDESDFGLQNNTFADYMNHIATTLANDSKSNQETLKTNVTVLNGIQDSRDSVSGVSLDEEASNMMMYMSAYSASSRLLTTLDQALDILINSTGLVGR